MINSIAYFLTKSELKTLNQGIDEYDQLINDIDYVDSCIKVFL